MEDIIVGWMTWCDIVPYKEQLIDMERELIVKYHYPDWDISRKYPEASVDRLEEHLANGNTYFWGIRTKSKLLGYYWGYACDFIDTKRWNLRSLMILPEINGKGYAKQAISAAHQKALELGCTEAATDYAPFNRAMAGLIKSCGYEIKRIEVVKKLIRK